MSLRTNVSALSSLALAVTAGCVSQSQYDRVVAERDSAAQEAVLARGQVVVGRERYAKLSMQLTETAEQLATARQQFAEADEHLGQTRALLASAQSSLDAANSDLSEKKLELTAAHQDQAQLVITRVQLTESEQDRRQVHQMLLDTQNALASAQKDQVKLKATEKSLTQSDRDRADLREKLAASTKSADDLNRKLDGLTSDLASLREEQTRQAAEAQTKLNKAQAELADARKDHVELEQVRLKLVNSQQAISLANTKLPDSDKRMSELRAKLDTQTKLLKRLQDEARLASGQDGE